MQKCYNTCSISITISKLALHISLWRKRRNSSSTIYILEVLLPNFDVPWKKCAKIFLFYTVKNNGYFFVWRVSNCIILYIGVHNPLRKSFVFLLKHFGCNATMKFFNARLYCTFFIDFHWCLPRAWLVECYFCRN